MPILLQAQETKPLINSTLDGVVVDAVTKRPLEGASLQLLGVTHSTKTDSRGQFRFVTGQKFPYTITVSFVGYKTKEVVADGSPLTIELEQDATGLDEVVVVGYATQKRSDLVGSVTKVNPENLKNIPVASVDAQLQGAAAGVQINSNTGVPGDGIHIRVRGATSINATNNPLFIIDGTYVNNTSLQTFDTGGRATSPLADISPADIESIEVLKDATATSIYGARGANGVVIITTKRGAYQSRPKLQVNYSQGTAKAVKLWELTTGPEHATLVNEWNRNNGLPEPYRPVSEGGRGLPEEQQTYDRQSLVFRTAKLLNADASITGGTDKTTYYLGGSYTSQESILKPIHLKRTSVKLNLDQKLTNWATFGASNSFNITDRNQARAGDGPQGGMLQAAINSPTITPIFYPDGTPGFSAGFDNPQLLIDNYDIGSKSLRYLGNVFAELKFLEKLTFKSSFGVDYNNYNEHEYWNSKLLLGRAPTNGLATSALSQYTTWVNEQTIAYNDVFEDRHTLGILFGNTLQGEVLELTQAEGRGFPNDNFKIISAAANRTGSQSWSKATLASFFGRVDYNFSNKYYLDFTFRADGSSRFGENNRWGYFPAVGGAWRVNEEDFLRGVQAISNLKLRASYGVLGNQGGIADFASKVLWNGVAPYTLDGAGDYAGISPEQLGNPDLKWEETSQFNVGVDLGLLANRINLEFNYYSKYTKDALLQIPVPALLGYESYFANAGEISNRGFEFSINSVNVRAKDFQWSTNFNISHNDNKVEKLETPLSYYSRGWVRVEEGYPLQSWYLWEQLYVDPNTGDAVFRDVDDNGVINDADRQILGTAQPKYFGGLSNTFNYKQFDLNFLFTFQQGNKVLNLMRFFGERGGQLDVNRILFKSQLDRWQQPGDDTTVPRLVAGDNYGRQQSSRYLEDGSFVRLKNLVLGYTLPRQATKYADIRFYVLASNILTFTKYTGPDPESNVSSEQNIQGLDQGTPPQPRSFQFGVNLTF
ncbi:SusC/RagA family TonB-linked outer membrane protein [Parapedobacter sp. 2B3]|uniref:SusC/RagA family TonB-linked outer membrane protein n=1 Tax=Parapedobacter sp. 2B3 TaxID=3342381 RepID=UPI0035B6496D